MANTPERSTQNKVSRDTIPRYQTANAKTYRFTSLFKNELRKNPTEAEKIMWDVLRNKKIGHKIRRQHIIDDFIVDFVCLRKKLVIEIDGKIHLQQKEYDELRSERLNEFDYDVIRFTNDVVFSNSEFVALKIKEALDNKPDLQDDKLSTTQLGVLKESNKPKIDLQAENKSYDYIELIDNFGPIDVLHYFVAVLNSLAYREKYKEFLKIDFPRIPCPTDKESFWQMVKLGGEIIQPKP